MKFVIYTTRSYSGGNIVLRSLCRLLNERGHDARIISYYTSSDLNHPTRALTLWLKWIYYLFRDLTKFVLVKMRIKTDALACQKCPKKIYPYVDSDTIVVYPEAIYGNPFHASRVVRWFLFYNRFSQCLIAYGENELIFSFREKFNDYNLNPTCRLFTLNYFDTSLYKQTNFGERKGVCYIVRKGKNRTDLPKVFNGPIIDDLPEKEKVAVLNRCKYCYDYDTQTFYTSIACVCGCVPIVMMEPGKTKSDYLGEGDVDYGKAYGDTPEQIEYAIRTRSDRLKMLDFSESNKKNIDFFIQEVEKYFGK